MKRADCPLHVVKPEPEPASTERTAATSKLWRDKAWKYTRSEATDVAKTFARIRRELAAKPVPAKKARKP